MPQIANQDYHVITPVCGVTFESDAYVLGEVMANVQRGTIFDCIIAYSKDSKTFMRPVEGGGYFTVIAQAQIKRVYFNYTSPLNYFGLSAIQIAEGNAGYIPEISFGPDDTHLYESTQDKYVCVDDKLIEIVVDDNDEIIALNVTENSPGGDYVNISYDDLQNLRGIQL